MKKNNEEQNFTEFFSILIVIFTFLITFIPIIYALIIYIIAMHVMDKNDFIGHKRYMLMGVLIGILTQFLF